MLTQDPSQAQPSAIQEANAVCDPPLQRRSAETPSAKAVRAWRLDASPTSKGMPKAIVADMFSGVSNPRELHAGSPDGEHTGGEGAKETGRAFH